MTTEQLKPCPFCAAEAELVDDRIYARHFQFCILYSQVVYDFKSTMWNTRPIEDAIRAKLAIAVEALKVIQNGEMMAIDGVSYTPGLIAKSALDKIGGKNE